MGKSTYSAGKRQRERDKERKRKEKSARRRENTSGTGGVPIATADQIQGGAMLSVEEVMQSIHAPPDSTPRATVPGRLFVGGLGFNVTSADLRATLERFGAVEDAFVVTDRDTGESRGFGFVTLADRRDATRAIKELDNTDLQGRALVVRLATERQR